VNLLFAIALAIAAPNAPSQDGPFTCNVPILDPQAVHTASGTDPVAPKLADDQLAKNAQSDVDLGGDFRDDFGVRADFTLPYVAGNTDFYSNWIILIPYHKTAFVQLELIRWKKYDFREEIGLTWSLPDGDLIYRDTEVFLSDSPHQLGIAVHGKTIAFTVDGNEICHAPKDVFFEATDQLYYQLGTEVRHVGDHPAGTLSNIEIKDGSWDTYFPAEANCIYHGYGVSWEFQGNGSYEAAGAFDEKQPDTTFTGNTPDESCRMYRGVTNSAPRAL
jgi:hypothetical protein